MDVRGRVVPSAYPRRKGQSDGRFVQLIGVTLSAGKELGRLRLHFAIESSPRRFSRPIASLPAQASTNSHQNAPINQHNNFFNKPTPAPRSAPPLRWTETKLNFFFSPWEKWVRFVVRRFMLWSVKLYYLPSISSSLQNDRFHLFKALSNSAVVLKDLCRDNFQWNELFICYNWRWSIERV